MTLTQNLAVLQYCAAKESGTQRQALPRNVQTVPTRQCQTQPAGTWNNYVPRRVVPAKLYPQA
jgi:hypothetical protein